MEESLSQQKFETNRDDLFDVLKGIAIILVIVGHCHLTKLRPIIYSFHIPIFFFITGYFLKIRPLRQEITLSIKRLIIQSNSNAFTWIQRKRRSPMDWQSHWCSLVHPRTFLGKNNINQPYKKNQFQYSTFINISLSRNSRYFPRQIHFYPLLHITKSMRI